MPDRFIPAFCCPDFPAACGDCPHLDAADSPDGSAVWFCSKNIFAGAPDEDFPRLCVERMREIYAKRENTGNHAP